MHDPYSVHPRKNLSSKQRLQMFVDAKGICCVCGGKIDGVRDAWIEHINPLWLNGDNSAPNMQPAHIKCAKAKTAGEATDRAKGKRIAEKHYGARKSARPMPGSRASGWRKKMNGEVIKR
jgi:5-methylcytosine-specific restriction protein A